MRVDAPKLFMVWKEPFDNVLSMNRSRLLLSGLVFAMVAAACGAGDDPAGAGLDAGAQQDSVAQESSSESQNATTGTDESDGPDDQTLTEPADPADDPAGSEQPADSEERPAIEGTPAPDFSLAMGDGSTFVMSEAAKPVYLVFWAEW